MSEPVTRGVVSHVPDPAAGARAVSATGGSIGILRR